MAQPVLIDDGGSTRIKQLKGPGPDPTNGRLDNLIEVDTSSAPAKSTDFARGPFSQVQIVCMDSTGAVTSLIVPPIAMALNHTFKVHSGNHRLEGRIVDRTTATPDPGSATDCQITISGVSGTEPIVEARHNNGQRRYIISNAPPIGKVEVNAAGPPKQFNVPGGIIYTVVILS
jgi:hypothetical protein